MARLTICLMCVGWMTLVAGCDPDLGAGGNMNGSGGGLAVNAGSDQGGVEAGASVSLFSSAGGVADDEAVSFRWEQLTGPPVELNGEDTASVGFTAPDVDPTREFEVLEFQVTVTDSDGNTATDTVVVTVRP